MKKLVLMRHAKSDWNQNEPDKRRPLNPRGRAAAPRMAEWLRESAFWPDVLLCSTATRTVETWQLMCEKDGAGDAQVEFLDELYLAHELVIYQMLCDYWTRSNACETLMVLGHNPGMENLVAMIAGVPLEMPTAAVAVFCFPELPRRNHVPREISWLKHQTPKKLPE
ncbi:MAG: histidine phosphatase family protein [Pirellula sp.]|jgi:phosphohistidine phosphatase|nr:histidine phosphatase family protein [Pirellula sp.]